MSGDRHGPACSPDEGCALCGDVAVPARVLRIDSTSGMAAVVELARLEERAGEREAGAGVPPPSMTVALDLVEGVGVGDVVLVHQGFAIERVRP